MPDCLLTEVLLEVVFEFVVFVFSVLPVCAKAMVTAKKAAIKKRIFFIRIKFKFNCIA